MRGSKRRFTMWPSAVAMPSTEDEVREVFRPDLQISRPTESDDFLARLGLAWMTAAGRIARHDRR